MNKSSMTTLTILKANLKLDKPQHTSESSTTISLSGIWSAEDSRSCSLTPTSSNSSIRRTCTPMASKTPLDPRNSLDLLAGNGKSVINSTWGNVEAQAADTNTPAKNAVSLGMGNQHVPTRIEQSGWCPKYLRYNIWDPDGNLPTSTTEWTETALPLPRPPLDELSDQTTIDTITRNPDLFKVVSPIKVDVFERLLDDHPNQPFVHSVCDGLRFGFWPWAKTLRPDYPKELDLS